MWRKRIANVFSKQCQETNYLDTLFIKSVFIILLWLEVYVDPNQVDIYYPLKNVK